MSPKRLPLAAVVLLGALGLAPSLAHACPQCAGRADGGIGQFVALGLFVTFPFALAFVVARVVKRGDGSRTPADRGL